MDEHTLWPLLTGLLGSLAGFAALLGVWLSRKRVPAEVRLITSQADAADAARGKSEAERDSIAFNVVSKALQDAERTIDRLRDERDNWRERAEVAETRIAQLLEEQKERHRMANELHAMRLRWAMLQAGAPFEEVQAARVEPIYPEAEGKA